MNTKKCSKCDNVKPLADYYKNAASKDGHRPNCKACVAVYDRLYRDKQCKRDRKEYFAAYVRNKRATDDNYRLADNLRTRLYTALQGNGKAATTEELLGCTFEQAVAHIEVQFTEGMSWAKMGVNGIHIDHIRPCASFDLTDPEQQRECFHYTNLQPLWAKDNLRKADKWETTKQP